MWRCIIIIIIIIIIILSLEVFLAITKNWWEKKKKKKKQKTCWSKTVSAVKHAPKLSVKLAVFFFFFENECEIGSWNVEVSTNK